VILPILLLIPLAGGILAGFAGERAPRLARWICLLALALDLILALPLGQNLPAAGLPSDWAAEFAIDWIPALGIGFHLAIDGLSWLMVLLTLVLGLCSVGCAWTEIEERVGFFHFNLMWVLTGVLGVFLALDLFLFYFFWELMVVPMYFLIGIWGHENRTYAATKFFLFTQAGGLLMLIAILTLVRMHADQTGFLTFDAPELLGTALPATTAMLLMLGFFVAFAVKLPSLPVHTWLPDAHTEAPTAGSVILAGLLLKTGAYGLMRFALPLFPGASASFAPVAMALGAVSIVYGSVMALAQTDLKRLVAYTSVSHLGFVMLGIYAGNLLALQGVVMQMICHGLSTGGLFILVGLMQERIHTRDIGRMGGFAAFAPRMAGLALVVALAGMGLPGLGNFVAEILTLVGAFQRNVPWTVVATLGLIGATIYTLVFFQRSFQGPNVHAARFADVSGRETFILSVLIVALVWLGLYPKPVLETAESSLARIQELASEVQFSSETSSQEASSPWHESHERRPTSASTVTP
jgi:NADH-quinone oxidoreductase subunit M